MCTIIMGSGVYVQGELVKLLPSGDALVSTGAKQFLGKPVAALR